MRVIFLYPYLPSPDAGHGSARLVSRLLADLSDVAEITLVCAYRPGERHLLDSVRPLCHDLRAVERRFSTDMGPVRRTTERGTTGLRMLSTGFPVSVVKLRRSGIRRALREALQARSYDLAHVEQSTMGQYVDQLPPGLPSVLVDHEAGGSGDDASRWASYVRKIYPLFSQRLVLSAEDRADLKRLVPGLSVGVRPPGIVVPPEVRRDPDPDRVLFFGSPGHAPNRDSLDWIVQDVFPALQQRRPSVKMVCAGFPRDDAAALRAAAAGVEVLGFVDDLATELTRAAAVLSPVRLGRGVRIKNLEALAHGVPLVTTGLGHRGLGEVPDHVVRTAEDSEGLAAAVAALLGDREAAESAAAEGRAAVSELFTFERQATITADTWRALLR